MLKEIEPKELFDWAEREALALIDVREEEEFASYHIANSLFMPLSRFHPTEIKSDLPLIFICRSGVRSKKAASLFLSLFPSARVYNLKGGLLAWSASSFPLVK